jgi:hypothetical protein
MGIWTPKIDCAVLIGSGALENSWKPVFSALRRFSNHAVNSQDIANLMLARLVFEPRFHGDYLLSCSERTRPDQERYLAASLARLGEFKKILAEEINRSTINKEVMLRENQSLQVQRYLDKRHAMIVTTNWSVRELQTLGVKSFIALHGTPEDAHCLYLPSETSVDRSHNRETSVKLGAIHHEAIKCMENASLILIWGLGINALDIEVTALLSETFAKKSARNLEYRVVIFDRDPKNIAERLTLFGANAESIELNELS